MDSDVIDPGGRAMQVTKGVALGFLVVALWLLPMTIYGVAYVRWFPDSEGVGEILVWVCFVLGYIGYLTAPIIAVLGGRRRLGSMWSAVSGGVTALLIYTPASYAALGLIIELSPSLAPGVD